jgi:hypothetical protein
MLGGATRFCMAPNLNLLLEGGAQVPVCLYLCSSSVILTQREHPRRPPHDCFTSYNLAPDHPQPVREGEEVTESRQHCPNKRGHVATPGRLQVASWTTESACGVGRLPRAAAERPPMAKGISSRTRPGFSLENSSGAEGRAPCKRPPSL